MRVQQPVDYKNLTQAVRPGVCPLCVFLKDVQSRCVREEDTKCVESLCNFHTWAIAGAAPARVAAELFLRLLQESQMAGSNPLAKGCSVCRRIDREEEALLDELVQKFAQEKFREWMRQHGALCFPHARKLISSLPERLRVDVREILAREIAALKKDLDNLLRNSTPGEKAHAGILGRAAESLAAQRGLEASQQ